LSTTGGSVPGVRQSEIGKLRDIGVGIGARLEEHFDDADAEQRARLHMVDAAGQREEPFQGVGDVGFDVLGRHARIERRHHDFRQVDRREQIHRHPHKAGHADHHQRQADHNDEIRVPDGEA
jgi:hypothetical protein